MEVPIPTVVVEQENASILEEQNVVKPLTRGSMEMAVNRMAKLQRRSKESLAFHQDPFNRPELVHTLRGRELALFIAFYALGVLAIVLLFESVMPVFWVDDQSRSEQRRRAAIVYTRSVMTVMRDSEITQQISAQDGAESH